MAQSQTATVTIEQAPSSDRLAALGVFSWPIWTREVSTFPWTYDDAETCYFLEGDVVVTLEDGSTVRMGQGDLVVFPAGMSCTWEIRSAVKKHYSFG